MNKSLCLTVSLMLTVSAAGAVELSGVERAVRTDRGTGAGFGLLFDGGFSGAPAAEPVDAAGPTQGAAAGLEAYAAAERGETPAPPEPSSRKEGAATGLIAGVKNGGEQGALGGFFAVISPAAALMSEAFSRDMSRHYDGPGAGGSGAYWAGGIVLGVLLYIPALIAGGLGAVGGAVAGAVSEIASPGSTAGWDVEKKLFG